LREFNFFYKFALKRIEAMKNLMISLTAAALLLCFASCEKRGADGRRPTTGVEFLTQEGIYADSLLLPDAFDFANDGEQRRTLWLDSAQISTLHLDSLLQADAEHSPVRVWGVRALDETKRALLFGQVYYGDTRPSFVALYGPSAEPLDFMLLGECGGLNLNYWVDLDEHSRHVGVDSAHFALDGQQGFALDRYLTMYSADSDNNLEEPLWTIAHRLNIRYDERGRFVVDSVKSEYPTDTLVLEPRWLTERQVETLDWIPRSDSTFAARVAALRPVAAALDDDRHASFTLDFVVARHERIVRAY